MQIRLNKNIRLEAGKLRRPVGWKKKPFAYWAHKSDSYFGRVIFTFYGIRILFYQFQIILEQQNENT